MSEQLELEMSKSWCTAGCNQLLTPQEFKSHECYSRSRPVEKLPSVVFSFAEIKQAEDAALERERLRTLNDESARRLLAAGTVGEKVAEVLAGGPPFSCPKQHIQPEETYQQDTAFDIYRQLDQRLINMLKSQIDGIRIECPEHKKSKWNRFAADCNIVVPSEFGFLKSEKYNLAGWVRIHIKEMTDEDFQLLDTIPAISRGEDPKPYSSKIKKKRKRNKEVVGEIHDVKLAMTLLATDPTTFKITSVHKTKRERGPRKPKEMEVAADVKN